MVVDVLVLNTEGDRSYSNKILGTFIIKGKVVYMQVVRFIVFRVTEFRVQD